MSLRPHITSAGQYRSVRLHLTMSKIERSATKVNQICRYARCRPSGWYARTPLLSISPRLNSDGHDDQKLGSDDPPTHNRFIIPGRDHLALLCVVPLRFVVTSPEIFRCHPYSLYVWLLGAKTCVSNPPLVFANRQAPSHRYNKISHLVTDKSNQITIIEIVGHPKRDPL